MKKKIAVSKLYDIIPSQNAMYLMYKFGLHKQMTQIPTSFITKEELDFTLLQKAFNIEIERNDCLRLRFIKEKGKIKQYFSDVYTYQVPVKYFSTLEEQEQFFSEDAPKTVRFLKDEVFRIYFFKTQNEGFGVYSNFSHLIMDAMGIGVFYVDLLNVYTALKTNSELPKKLDSYEDYIVKMLAYGKDTQKKEKHEKFYKDYFSTGGEPFYAAVHGIEFLDNYRKKKKNPDIRVPMAYNPLWDKCDMKTVHISKEETEKIFSYCNNIGISPESVFQFGMRTYCSGVNRRIDDVSMMAVCSNRITYKDKNMSGCMAQPIILRTILSEEFSFNESVQKMADVRTSVYRHSLYPYTDARDMFLALFNFGPIQGANSMMFSWIPFASENLPVKISFKTYNLQRYFTPLYAMVIPDSDSKGITIYYMYRTKLITEAQISNLHKNTIKTILEGIENPDISLGKLLDNIS